MRSIGIPVALAMAACGFDGGAASPIDLPPDADVISEPDAGPTIDAPPEVCADFKLIGTGRYALSTNALTWDEATAYCTGLNQARVHLVIFETTAEISTVVQGLPLTVEAWTGVIQKKPANQFAANWINTVRGTPVPTPFPWDSYEPNDGGGWFNYEDGEEDTAELRPNAHFNDERRSNRNRALCECQP